MRIQAMYTTGSCRPHTCRFHQTYYQCQQWRTFTR